MEILKSQRRGDPGCPLYLSCSGRDQSPAARAVDQLDSSCWTSGAHESREKVGLPWEHTGEARLLLWGRSKSSAGLLALAGSRESGPAVPRHSTGPPGSGARGFPELEGLLEFLV